MQRWLWLSALVVVLDQLSKWLAQHYLQLHQPVPVTAMFNLTLMYNTGAAFSFLSDAGGWQRWFFTVLAIGVSIVLIVWLKRLPPGERGQAVGLSLIIGGAIGNLIDRLLLGHVVDFIQVYYDVYYWPTFNLADSAITVGAILLIVLSFRSERAEKA